MSLQRRLAIVPGSEVLSPKEAQRILHENRFTDDSKSRNDHSEQGRGPRRTSSPRPPRRLCLQVSQQNRNLQSPGENTRPDKRGNGAITMHNSKQDSRSKHNIYSGHYGRYGGCVKSRGNCQKLDSDAHAQKKRQNVAVHQDDHRRYSNDISKDTPLMGEITSDYSKQSSGRDMAYASGATNVFSKVRSNAKTIREALLTTRPAAKNLCYSCPSIIKGAPLCTVYVLRLSMRYFIARFSSIFEEMT